MINKNVIIVGAMYSLNYGDSLICETVQNIIEKEYGFKTIIVGISGKEGYPKPIEKNVNNNFLKNKISKIFPINKYIMIRSRKKLKLRLAEINPNDFDAIIFAGGQLFMDCFIDYINVIVIWAKKNNIPVYFNCCGMGHINFFNRKKLQNCLIEKNVKNVSLRDGVSKFNKYFNIDKKIERIYDPVIEVSKYYKKNKNRNITLGIGIIHPINFRKNCVNINENDYENIIRNVIIYCQNKNIEFQLFTNGDIMDQQYCENLADKIGLKDMVSKRPSSPKELLDIITNYERILSSRLHSLIIASSYGIPVSALIWDLKVYDFMKIIGRENLCISLKYSPSYEMIENNLNDLFEKDIEYKFDKFQLTSESLKNFFNL